MILGRQRKNALIKIPSNEHPGCLAACESGEQELLSFKSERMPFLFSISQPFDIW